MSPKTWVISIIHQVKGLNFRSELCFCFLLCITAPIPAWHLHSPAVGGMEAVLLLLFLHSQVKTQLCPYQVSKSCIFNPNGVESSMYVSKIWLPSNRLQSENKKMRKMFPWKSNKSGWKNWQEKNVCYSVKWSSHQAWCPEPKSGDTQYIRQKKLDDFHYCLNKLHKVCAAAARTFPISVIITFVWLVGKKPFSITRHYDRHPKEPSPNSHVRIWRSVEIVVQIHFLIFFTWHSIYFLGSRDWFNHKHIMIMQAVQVLG